MAVKTRCLSIYYLKLLGVREIPDRTDYKTGEIKQFPDKRLLVFASEFMLQNGENWITLPIEQAEALGGTWHCKKPLEWCKKNKDLLKIGQLYEVKAAVENYSIRDDDSGRTNSGTWYDLVSMKQIDSIPVLAHAA
ncbi:MAG: hypothetical protein NVS2B14_11970 [Chamaesiphon sp.]